MELLLPLYHLENTGESLQAAIFNRMARLIELGQTHHNIRYSCNVLADSYQDSYQYCVKHPHATVADVYRAKVNPESSTAPLYCIDTAIQFEKTLIAANSPVATTMASKLLAKARNLEISSVRYISAQIEKILRGSIESDVNCIVHFLGCEIMGNVPSAQHTASTAMRCKFYSDTIEECLRFIRYSGSTPLFSCLSEYLYAASEHCISVLRFLVKPGKYRLPDGPDHVRQTYYLQSKRTRFRRKRTPHEKVSERATSDRAVAQYSVKRKASSRVVRNVGMERLKKAYTYVLTCAPSSIYVAPDVLKKVQDMGMDSENAHYVYLHACTQRNALKIEPLLPEVAVHVRKAVGGPQYVHICLGCYSLRTRCKHVNANRRNSGVIVDAEGRVQCASCNSRSVWVLDGCGIVFKSLAKASDREPISATICTGCKQLVSRFTFKSIFPYCKSCVKAPPRASRCCLCSCHISKTTTQHQVLAQEEPGSRTFVATVCGGSCALLEDKGRIWQLSTLRRSLDQRQLR